MGVRRGMVVSGIACSLALAACGGSPGTGHHGAAPPVRATTVPPSTTAAGPLEAFRAESATFVSAQVGWVLGSAPCGGESCVVLLRTADGGRSWVQVDAPPIAPFEETSGGFADAEVRFADPLHGWAFRPEPSPGGGAVENAAVLQTTDGGAHWLPALVVVPSNDFGIADLEAADGSVQAVFTASPVAIETAVVGAGEWALSATTVPLGAGPVPSEQLVLQGSAGWVIENDRVEIGGARLTDGSWQPWSPPCLGTGGAVGLAASSALDVAAVCDEGVWSGGPERLVLELSHDGGTSFAPAPGAVPAGALVPGVLASPAAGVVFAASAQGGILATFDAGTSWTAVLAGTGDEELLQLGFTTATQGLAIEGQGTMLMTYDGGHSWAPVDFPEVRP